MTLSLYVTFMGIFMLSTVIIWKTILHRNKITVMAGMMIAMALGMSAGLTIGVIAGIILSGNLFYSTVLAMILGVIFGFLAGMPISLMAVLDGTLAGIMGGMMGAMLGEMIAPEFQDALIRIMFVLFIATILILFQMMHQEFIKTKGWLSHPVIMIFGFALFITVYNQIGPLTSTSPFQNNNDNMNTKNLVIQADEFSFSPNQVDLSAGETIKITLDNIGEVEHDLEVIGMEAEVEEMSSSHDHHQEDSQIHIHSNSGEKQEISFTPLNPGRYRYICTIPGHAESGMTGMIEIVS
ncbi:plastocyanin/azurin family copper-binding protein [Virgibacillus natechei]|uniref:cupredoxin domain-containing protein n=1 Tax=Virgibacillus sp. CBA3643 TaxID=2942278 RepID=UPI0035A39C82